MRRHTFVHGLFAAVAGLGRMVLRCAGGGAQALTPAA